MQNVRAGSFINWQEAASDSFELDMVVVIGTLNCLVLGELESIRGLSAVSLSG